LERIWHKGTAMLLSYSEIAACGVSLAAADVAALALAASRELVVGEDGTARGLPRPERILLSSAGAVTLAIKGAEVSEQELVAQLAALVRRLLRLDEDTASPTRTRVPGALLVLLARADGQIDGPVLSLEAFVRALERYGPADMATLSAVYRRCADPGSAAVLGDWAAAAVLSSPDRTDAIAASPTARGWWKRTGAVAAVFLGGVAGWSLALALAERSRPDLQSLQSAREVVTPITIELQPETGVKPPEPAVASRRPSTRALRPVAVAPLVLSATVGADAFSPSFAHDSRELMFHAGRAQGALMRASIGRAGEVRVATVLRDGAANYHASLSPDGEWMAYDSDRDGTRGVYVARSDAREARKISGDGYAAVPSWSTDGRRLAFVKAEARRPRVWNVWVADLETGALSRVSRHAVGQAWRASWFPDGDRLAYSVEDTLVIASLRDGSSRVLRSPRRGRLIRTPAVSPDGKWIVFQVHRDGVWLLDVSSGSMRRVLGDLTAEEFAWSPDGGRVAYHTRRGGAWSVWQMSFDPA
jgi:hypothetical protein